MDVFYKKIHVIALFIELFITFAMKMSITRGMSALINHKVVMASFVLL